jgi:GDPmannose 4,6-dehydratase
LVGGVVEVIDDDLGQSGSGVSRPGFEKFSLRLLWRRSSVPVAPVGDPSKARQRLGWRHKTSFGDMVKEMVAADLIAIRGEKQRNSRHHD